MGSWLGGLRGADRPRGPWLAYQAPGLLATGHATDRSTRNRRRKAASRRPDAASVRRLGLRLPRVLALRSRWRGGGSVPLLAPKWHAALGVPSGWGGDTCGVGTPPACHLPAPVGNSPGPRRGAHRRAVAGRRITRDPAGGAVQGWPGR